MKKVLSIFLTLALCLCLSACGFVSKPFVNATAIECPDFVGMTIEEVQDHELYVDDTFEFRFEYITSDKYEIGTVCKQSSPVGEKLKKGSNITLYISKGKELITVPDVYGKDESSAVSELKEKGFDVVVTEVEDKNYKNDCVVKTEPERGTKINPDTKIIVYVNNIPEEPKPISYEGTYTADDGSTLKISKTTELYRIDISIYRLITMEDGVGNPVNSTMMEFMIIDAAEGAMGGEIVWLNENKVKLTFTRSNWDLLPNGTEIVFEK